jgi:hypothetical protein
MQMMVSWGGPPSRIKGASLLDAFPDMRVWDGPSRGTCALQLGSVLGEVGEELRGQLSLVVARLREGGCGRRASQVQSLGEVSVRVQVECAPHGRKYKDRVKALTTQSEHLAPWRLTRPRQPRG